MAIHFSLKKRCLLFIIFALLFVFVASVYSQNISTNNEFNPAYLDWLSQQEQEESEMFTDDGHALGEIPVPFIMHTELPDEILQQLLPLEAAPASFDLRTTGKLTSVKDQGTCGSCWTFATMGNIESRWLVDSRGTYDLSEDNLNTCHPPFDPTPCNGGNILMSAAYLARGSGPKSESDDPYSETHTTVDCPTGFDPQGIITSIWYLPTTDPALIKTLIQTYGALYTNFRYESGSYTAGDYTYYYSGSDGTNHAVTLVGWDDTKVTAGGTGAWIIKNSWGPSWGESGYFYIAYQDTKVNSSVNLVGYDYDDYDPDQTVNTYSEAGCISAFGFGSNSGYALVKYIASGHVQLTKVGTYTFYAGCTVAFDVYDNFDGTTLSGSLGSISSQTCTYEGYHSFDLSTPINLTNGNDYYVKVHYTTATGQNYPIPVEDDYPGFVSSPTIETGVFWASSTGSSWTSINGYGWDPCVYSYTTNMPEIDVQRPASTSIADGGTDNLGSHTLGTVNLAYTIDNTIGTAQLNVTSVTASNYVNSSGFSVSTTLPLNVAAGGTGTLDVSFNVPTAGAFSLDVDLASNDADENPYDVTITGTGTYYEDTETVNGSGSYSFNEGGDGHDLIINFTSITGSGDVTVKQYTTAPTNVPGANVLDNYFEITVPGGITSFTANLTFQYLDGEASGYTESSDFFGIGKFNSSTNTWQWLGGTVNAGSNTVTVNGVTSCSDFAVFRRIFGDADGDGYVDAADLQNLGDCWHLTNSGEFSEGSDARFFNYNKDTDGGNQIIDASDLQIFGDSWHNGTP